MDDGDYDYVDHDYNDYDYEYDDSELCDHNDFTLYDEYGDPVDPDDAWLHDQLYDAWAHPVDQADDDGDRRHPMDPDDEVLPSGYTRRQYKDWGATGGDIEYWGLDQPGAPPPEAAGWVAWEMAEEIGEADGCGLALALGFLWALGGALSILLSSARRG